MSKNYSEFELQTICFAAICQCICQITELAKRGTWNEEISRIMIRALAVDSPKSIDEIYPVEKIQYGLRGLISIFEQDGEVPVVDQTRLVMQITNLGTTIYKQLIDQNHTSIFAPRWKFSPELLRKLDVALSRAKQFGYRPTSDENVANIAEVYMQEISPVTDGHIKIFGQAEYLKNVCIQNRIRTLIFAAVRAVILWRQFGGKRRSFLFGRKKMNQCAKGLLQSYV